LETMGRGEVGWEKVGLEGGWYEVCATRRDRLLHHGLGRATEERVFGLLEDTSSFGTGCCFFFRYLYLLLSNIETELGLRHFTNDSGISSTTDLG
jgi:hypothetical protein